MKDKNVFEKARMNTVLIPLAGFIAAAALILAVIFAASFFGAFTSVPDEKNANEPSFTEPETDEFDYGINNATDDGPVRINAEDLKENGGIISYIASLSNESDEDAFIKDVRCMLYSGKKCIKSSSVCAPFTLTGKTTVFLSGDDESNDADAVVFSVSWENGDKKIYSAYAVCKK